MEEEFQSNGLSERGRRLCRGWEHSGNDEGFILKGVLKKPIRAQARVGGVYPEGIHPEGLPAPQKRLNCGIIGVRSSEDTP